ncbi:MAG TPA: S-layer homology domain-containing protein [Anaerovoracaceae bacterium]|nr:S-layer homology domain-containing protein [Anaerovoracaceae bacterium]
MRKVLSFVLVLALVLSSFSMAFAADSAAGLTDISGNANEDAIQVAYDLGVITGNPDGTFQPDKAVTRAEFAAMLTRALAIPDSALAGYTSTTFNDTAGYGWAVPYLAFCQSKGIMLGDGAGNVMPGRTILVNEAMTMALRAIGYTQNSALLVGAWPANYVSIAQNEDLYDDVATETTVNKANAAQIIYNLLTVQKVAVNTDGTTDYLWKDRGEDTEANLLNTNLGCDEIEDAILGSTPGCTYDDAIISITKNLGAYGTAYINDDDELVAFTKDSTALTGSLNDDRDGFEVGDITYDIDDADNDFTSDAALFVNGDDQGATGGGIEIAEIVGWALANSDDEETVTLNVDLSGKTIKDVYSVVAWAASDSDLADSDVQEDIADKKLLDFDFIDDDDDNIDFNSFELAGADSLEDIGEDDVVYVYANSDDDIRKVAVGTETVEGVVDELEENDSSELDSVTIGDKEYDLSPIATGDAEDIDVDSEGTFYLDINGEIYDFDGTSGNADTFGIVEAWDQKVGNDFDNPKLKLYLSDDSEKSLFFSESYADVSDMEWVLTSDLTSVSSINTAMNSVITKGALIGYSLDSSGDIDTIDVTSKVFSGTGSEEVTFQSAKVLKVGTKSFSIDSGCVVFTYKDNIKDTGTYDIASLNDVETGKLTSPSAVILNEDGDVVAVLVDEYNTSGDDYIYGVINEKRTGKDDGGDEISRFVTYIDGTKVTYSADDVYSAKAGTFDVYKIKLDSSDIITSIESMNLGLEYKDEDESGWINSAAEKITDLGSDKTVITTTVGSTEYKYTVADDAVVYEYDLDDEEFAPAKLSALKDNGKFFVRLYDTKGNDADGIATLVIFYEE